MNSEQQFPQRPDLCVSMAGELRGSAQTTCIEYGFVRTWIGPCIVAFTAQGLCWFEPRSEKGFPVSLAKHWEGAELIRDDIAAHRKLTHFFSGDNDPVVHMRGTEFQLRVWRALLNIPFGSHTSYGELASELGDAKSARAVGSAVGKNHIAWLVPCHRVLPVAGGLGGYRWGARLKRLILVAEQQTVRPAETA